MIIIHRNCRIGHYCRIFHECTIGVIEKGNVINVPIIGNNIYIGCKSLILGNVRIGNNSKIGAASVVLKDVPENSTVVGLWK